MRSHPEARRRSASGTREILPHSGVDDTSVSRPLGFSVIGKIFPSFEKSRPRLKLLARRVPLVVPLSVSDERRLSYDTVVVVVIELRRSAGLGDRSPYNHS